MAIPIEQAPPHVKRAAAAHAADRDRARAEAQALAARAAAGEPGITVGVEQLLADLDADEAPPRAAGL
jgi:hypothetical protein